MSLTGMKKGIKIFTELEGTDAVGQIGRSAPCTSFWPFCFSPASTDQRMHGRSTGFLVISGVMPQRKPSSTSTLQGFAEALHRSSVRMVARVFLFDRKNAS
jgi:hypothetical protein